MNIIKKSILPTAIYSFNAILIKIPVAYVTDLEQIFQKVIWSHKRSQIASALLRKRNKVRDITPPDILVKLYYKAIIIITVWYWHKNGAHRSMEQNRGHRNKLTPYGQLIFEKGGKNIQWGKNSPFNKWYWENWIECKTIELDHLRMPHRRIDSKFIKNLNVQCKTINILEDNRSSKTSDFSHIFSNIFANICNHCGKQYGVSSNN
ncbi:hypothetical protein HJG60_010276 [Phyllostomus discolor]|uniref:Uncharacterized protein n=1 Tax=Phyllostomus discolor TaxID=89673 RepID=A0A834AZ27_9CHIR|nr:hypothetical protein HJG60_010276 [Phyllostomus discolor]